eukprot:180713_1
MDLNKEHFASSIQWSFYIFINLIDNLVKKNYYHGSNNGNHQINFNYNHIAKWKLLERVLYLLWFISTARDGGAAVCSAISGALYGAIFGVVYGGIFCIEYQWGKENGVQKLEEKKYQVGKGKYGAITDGKKKNGKLVILKY